MTDTLTRPALPAPKEAVLQLRMASSSAPVTASSSQRTITGLAVPYGPEGNSSMGAVTFSQGSLNWSSVGRIKLLKQHDPERSLGFATALDDRPDGLYATFSVADGPEGDLALSEATDGRRDGLSVGVMLDADVLAQIVEKWWEDDTSATAASGRLLEVSQVSLPAFDDARIDNSAAAAFALEPGQPLTLAVDFGREVPRLPRPATNSTATSPTTKENSTMETEDTAAVTTASTGGAVATAERPAASPPAGYAAAQVSSEAPVYTFDGRGPSFVRDAYNARFSNDVEAAARFADFNKRMAAGDEAQVGRLTAAVETRTTEPKLIQQGYRPDLMISTIDKGRPLTSRIGTTTITDATPFRIPTEGDFTGVGDHVEGTAHVAEGDMTLGDVVVTPGAVSGAYRLSRELIDASNPAIDKLALNAMLRGYRYATEAKVATALAAADSVADVSVNTVQKVRLALNSYFDTMLEEPTAIAAHSGFYADLLLDVDSTGRPMLASVNPQNAAAEPKAGFTGAYVDGTELYKAYAVSANDAFIYNANDIFIGESSVSTFRFEEVEGPGVIKLALFAYFVAKVTRAGSVVKITSKATD